MRFFDSHAHLTSLHEIDQAVLRAKAAGVDRILNICTDPASLEEGLSLEARFPEVQNAAATTPHDVEKEGQKAFAVFEKAAKEKKLAAIGETGLDYYYKELNREIQKTFLVKYLHLALECKLPVLFHCREAFCDLFEIADMEYQKNAPAVLHCFTGSIQEAEEVFKRGWHLSFSGIVTFKKSESLREVAKMAPLDKILIETDAPYLAPQSKRGKENEPSFIVETAQCIATARNISIEELAEATFKNAAALLGTT